MNWTATSKGLAALCILPGLAAPALAQLVSDAHEKPPRVELDTILPTTLMQSGVHRVEDNVRVKGTLFEFTLDSDLGRYDALSIPMALLPKSSAKIFRLHLFQKPIVYRQSRIHRFFTGFRSGKSVLSASRHLSLP